MTARRTPALRVVGGRDYDPAPAAPDCEIYRLPVPAPIANPPPEINYPGHVAAMLISACIMLPLAFYGAVKFGGFLMGWFLEALQ